MFTQYFLRSVGLCAAAFNLAADPASALEISGLIKVNGAERSGVLIAAYDCTDSRELGYVFSGATENGSGSAVNFSMSVNSENVRLELYYSEAPDTTPISEWCRAYVDCGGISVAAGRASVNADMDCGGNPQAPGVADIRYWIGHPDEWPVDQLSIGGRTLSKAQVLALMRAGGKCERSSRMLRELVAAKLNVAAGNDTGCVQEAISKADGWLARFPMLGDLRAANLMWSRVISVVKTLMDYNHGKLCASLRNVEDEDRTCRQYRGRRRE